MPKVINNDSFHGSGSGRRAGAARNGPPGKMHASGKRRNAPGALSQTSPNISKKPRSPWATL
jgi:hypothetical protein